ncbi:hypothetical protein OUZ56_021252 [Daphnia magna]|uniref:Uncharacterized protein n=1 Tax=Daphnia magna TaxID=35525 RepID=A0ABQ9ZGU7_9CRUS|nr:hypothetical protein OUZ56_021252 [Daphnia magna]
MCVATPCGKKQKKVESKRPKPYARPVPEAQKGVPLLNAEEQKQLEELNKTRATNAAVIAAAQKAAQEAENQSKYILEASLIRKEKEKLRLREEALQKTTVQTQPDPQPGPSKQRPTLLEKINQDIRAQTIPKPLPLEVRSTASTPRRRFSRIITSEKINKRLARKFAKHGWHRFLLLLGNTVFSTSNYVEVIFAAWENFSYSYFGTVTLIPAETLHSFLELLFWHKISSHHLRVTIQGGDLTIYERTSLMNYMMNETIQVLLIWSGKIDFYLGRFCNLVSTRRSRRVETVTATSQWDYSGPLIGSLPSPHPKAPPPLLLVHPKLVY